MSLPRFPPRMSLSWAFLPWDPSSSPGSGHRRTTTETPLRISKYGLSSRAKHLALKRTNIPSSGGLFRSRRLAGIYSTHSTNVTVHVWSPTRSNSMKAKTWVLYGISYGWKGSPISLFRRARITPSLFLCPNERYTSEKCMSRN